MMISLLKIVSIPKVVEVLRGTILVHKILGAAARSGKSLAEMKDLADKLVLEIKTIGLALSGATVPELANQDLF